MADLFSKLQLSAWCLPLVEWWTRQLWLTVLFLKCSPPPYVVSPSSCLVRSKLRNSSLVSLPSLLPSSNSPPIPIVSVLKTFWHHLLCWDPTVSPRVQTIIISHWKTPRSLVSHSYSFPSLIYSSQITMLQWEISHPESETDVNPFRVAMAAKNRLAPGYIPTRGSPYPVMIQGGRINAQTSQHHWDHYGRPLLPGCG